MGSITAIAHLIIGAAVLLTAFNGAPARARRTVKTYEINLDLPPEQRYVKLVPHFNSTVWGFYNKYFANDKILRDILYGISDKRGPENDEQQKEIEGLAAVSKLPLKFVKGIQMLYEIQTLMVPIVNFTAHQSKWYDPIPKGYEALLKLPWHGGCTGIIARNKKDNTVYHARNLDFSPVPFMTHLVYNGVFTKGGKEVFRSQMIAGYTMVITAFRAGENGYAVERNTRYTDHWGGNKEMIDNLEKGRTLNGWQLRKILESTDNFDDAIDKISKVPYVSTEYAIVSGVQKGQIISRNPDSVAYRQVLGRKNFDEPEDYIIITNFDFFWHDIREKFDPTGGGGFKKPTRREAAQSLLNSSSALTPEVLFQTINAPYVLADTVFQAIINVQLGLWNISQPDLKDGVIY